MQVSIDDRELSLLRARADHQQKIIDASSEVTRLKVHWDAKKEAAKAAKDQYDEAVDELRELIAEGADGQLTLQFDAVPANQSDSNLSWRDISVSELDVKPALIKKLQEIGVATLGQLENLEAKNVPEFPDGIESIKGWGPPKVKEVRYAFRLLVDGARGPDAEPIVEEAETAEQSPEPESIEAEAIDTVYEDVPDEEEEEQPEASTAEDPSAIRIRMTKSLSRLESEGFVKDAEFDAHVMGSQVVVVRPGKPSITLMQTEYQVIESQVAAS